MNKQQRIRRAVENIDLGLPIKWACDKWDVTPEEVTAQIEYDASEQGLAEQQDQYDR